VKKINSFFKLIKYELKRVARNKMVLSMLLGFSILLMLIVSFVDVGAKNLPVGIYTGGMEIEQIGVLDVIDEEFDKDKLIKVKSEKEGIEKVNKGELCFFIKINTDTSPITATLYYDGSSIVGRTIKDAVSETKSQYAYDVTNEFLKKIGIQLNEAYFDVLDFKKAGSSNVTFKQMPFGMEVACCVSIVVMFGLAYSISRDNETQVARNLSYIPMGTHKYLIVKILPYILLSVVELYILFVIGALAFDINYQIDILVLVLMSIFFIVATSMLGLLFSLQKSQLSTVFLDMVAVLLPLFVMTMAYVQGFPLGLQIFMYAFPMTAFVGFVNTMMYSGVIVWWKLAIFAIQSVVYYLLSWLILRRRVKGKYN